MIVAAYIVSALAASLVGAGLLALLRDAPRRVRLASVRRRRRRWRGLLDLTPLAYRRRLQ